MMRLMIIYFNNKDSKGRVFAYFDVEDLEEAIAIVNHFEKRGCIVTTWELKKKP